MKEQKEGTKKYELLGMDLSDDERAFLEDSFTINQATINHTRVATEIYFSKSLEKTADRIIASNEETVASQKRYAGALNWLTGGLVFVGAVQILFIALTAFGVIP